MKVERYLATAEWLWTGSKVKGAVCSLMRYLVQAQSTAGNPAKGLWTELKLRGEGLPEELNKPNLIVQSLSFGRGWPRGGGWGERKREERELDWAGRPQSWRKARGGGRVESTREGRSRPRHAVALRPSSLRPQPPPACRRPQGTKWGRTGQLLLFHLRSSGPSTPALLPRVL